MAHDVFISHSTRDKPVADAVCAALENAGIRCWIGPRDVQPGRSFAGEITRAIQQSKAMVLIFSSNSNTSGQVLREVQLAVESQLHILQFRIEEVLLNDDLKYYLSTPHWLDALTPPLEQHLGRLSLSIKTLLGKPGTEASQRQEVALPSVEERGFAPPAGSTPAKPPRRNLWLIAVVLAVLVSGVVLGLVFFRPGEQPKREAQPPASNTPIPSVTERPAKLPVRRDPISPSLPTPSTRAKRIFSHNFETQPSIFKPLFGPDVMNALNTNGEGQITAKSAGVLPAMLSYPLVDDFIIECEIRVETLPLGARYGFTFRATDVPKGGLETFYALLLDPNAKIAELKVQAAGPKWMIAQEQHVGGRLLEVGRKNLITLEVVGNRFRVFVNDGFGAEFSNGELKEGRIGLCLFGVDATPWTVHIDNFQVFLPPEKDQHDAISPSTPTPGN